MTRRPLALLALAVLACTPAGCERGAAPPAALRSALLITLDTTRADALAPYGGPPGLTPALDRLAREGIVYEQARSVAPTTLPSHASMLTGLYPPRHGVRDNSRNRLPASAVTLAERAREAGLSTAAFVAAVVLDPSFGLDQGFDTYAAPERSARATRAGIVPSRPGMEVAREALRWLRGRAPDERFFLWMHLFDPHAPYAPPSPLRERAGGNAYLGEIAAADEAVGWLLQALWQSTALDDALVIVVADHGEGLGAHGERTHGVFVYDTTLRVPLLMRHPDGHGAGTRSAVVASVADVYPTLVEALGLGAIGDVDGASLYRRDPPERGVYFESYQGYFHYGYAPLAGWIDARGKYVHGAAPQLFDPVADPRESQPLPLDSEIAQPYVDAIRRVGSQPALSEEVGVEADLVEQLSALGYATAGSGTLAAPPPPLEDTGLPDARERAHEFEWTREAFGLAGRGEREASARLFERVLASNPRHWEALQYLVAHYAGTRRCPEALALLERLETEGEMRASAHVNRGFCAAQGGELEEAIAHYERALALDANNPQALENLARTRERLEEQRAGR